MRKKAITGMLALAVAAALSTQAAVTAGSLEDKIVKVSKPETSDKSQEMRLKNYMQQMTLREKISQMVLIAADSKRGRKDIKNYNLGGVFFTVEYTAEEVRSIIQEVNAGAKIPVMAFSDEESMLTSRIKDNDYPYSPSQIRRSSNPEAMALALGLAISGKMKEVGLNGNFAPVLDLYSSKSAIRWRALHSNKYKLAAIGKAYVEGLHKNGIAASGKHFPGYGATEQHSDMELALNDITEKDLVANHKFVFDQLKNDLDAIMMSNIIYTNVDSQPALFSEKIVGWAREDFDGLIISDYIAAKSVDVYLGDDSRHRERAVRAVKAGVDIIIDDWKAKYLLDSIEDAVRNGEIPESRIDESVLRVLKFKEKYCGFTLP